MSHLAAFFLGLIQGVTEFFPVSSSAHMALARLFLHIENAPPLFDLSCHLGTLGALIWFLKGDIKEVATRKRITIAHLFIALIPLIPAYFLLRPLRASGAYLGSIGFSLIATSLLLFLAERIRLPWRGNLLRDLLLIGTLQSAALVPGISRSASTISCAHVLGWQKRNAVRFSFILAIPTILGGSLLELKKVVVQKELLSFLEIPCFIGLVTSFCVGSILVRFAISYLEKRSLYPFAWYCLALGIASQCYLYGIN